MIKLFGKHLNYEEIFIGAFIQTPFYFTIGWWVLLLMPISGLLWALGGAKDSNKLYRRLGVPLATCVAVIAYNWHFWAILAGLLPAFCAVSLGYGESSWLFRKLEPWFKEIVIDYPVRMITYALYWLSFGLALTLIK